MKRNPQSQTSTDFGLIAWLEETRIALPLKAVDCRFEITGAVARVELDQVYRQSAKVPLDCSYVFPLPAGAAVDRCELHVNGRVIRAVVKAENEAREIYARQKAAGRRVAMVKSERENLFTLQLGNLQPEDLVVVRFAWFQVLERNGDQIRFRVPTCPGIRYIPGKPLLRANRGNGVVDDTDQVPDASRISPPRIDALHPDAAYFAITGRLATSEVEPRSESSPSHPVHVREGGETIEVTLADRRAIPDCDFVLTWREPQAASLISRGWTFQRGAESFALLQLRAPETVPVAEHLAQDFYFLVDRSGSMSGAKWTQACRALSGFLKLLGKEDRVWITLFETTYRDFSDRPQRAAEVLADAGFQGLVAMGVAGGTELWPALDHVLAQVDRHSAGRRSHLVLITDGQVGNEAQILALCGARTELAIHTFGIDTAVNDAFLRSLAAQNRGGCWLQTPDDDIAGTVAALGDRLRRPVLTGLQLSKGWEPAGANLPDLHRGDVATVALRRKGRGALIISGAAGDGSECRLELGTVESTNAAIPLLWARERIAHLLGNGEAAAAIALAEEFNLICKGAAFIAWDEAEQVAVAREEIVQPALEPRYMRVSCMRDSVQACPSLSFDSMSYGDFSDEYLRASQPRHRSLEGFVERLEQQLQDATAEALISAGLAPSTATSWIEEQSKALGGAEAFKQVADRAKMLSSLMITPALTRRWAVEMARLSGEGSRSFARWIKQWEEVDSVMTTFYEVLRAKGVPEALLEHLLPWAVGTWFNGKREVARLERLLEQLENAPLSRKLVVERWRTFLEATVGIDEKVLALTAAWMPELAEASLAQSP